MNVEQLNIELKGKMMTEEVIDQIVDFVYNSKSKNRLEIIFEKYQTLLTISNIEYNNGDGYYEKYYQLHISAYDNKEYEFYDEDYIGIQVIDGMYGIEKDHSYYNNIKNQFEN